MKELLNKKVISLKINEDQSLLIIETTKETFIYETDRGYCSETWFADIIGVNYLIGSTVLKVNDLDLPDYNLNDGRCRRDEDSVYGIQLITDKGETNIIYRNSSNGYYGGNMYLLCSLSNLIEIKEDWQA